MSKLVSIISPCYNGAKYLPMFLNSVLSQTYDNIELIIINDASTDNTLEIINSYIDLFEKRGYKLVIIDLNANGGQAAAINHALPMYKGEYMMWMDSDDILLPEAITKKVSFLNSNPDIDFVLNQGYVVDESNLEKTLRLLKREKPQNEDNLFSDLIYEKNVVFAPGTIFVKSDSLKKAIPSQKIYESREGQNWQLMLPLAYCCKWGYINEPLFKYVVHEDSHSHANRTYAMQKGRFENFDILLKMTIKNIPTMPEEEIADWEEKITIKTLRRILSISAFYCNRADYLKAREELKRHNERISYKDSYYFYCTYRRIRSICKKILYPFVKYIRK